MQVDHQASTADVLQARERYVPRGVSTPQLVVTRAWGAKVWDADGREYLDFAAQTNSLRYLILGSPLKG